MAARRRAVRAARAVQACRCWTARALGCRSSRGGTLVATSAGPSRRATATTLTLTNSSVQHVGSSDNGGVPARKRAPPRRTFVHIEASKVRTEKAHHRVMQALSMVDRLFLMISDDLKGGGSWATETEALQNGAKATIVRGRKEIEKSLTSATAALNCALACEEDVCNKCAVAPTVDTTRKSVEPQTTSTLNMLLEVPRTVGIRRRLPSAKPKRA